MSNRWPYGMSIEDAAAFCGVSQSTFRGLVADGKAPSAVAITQGRKVWLRPLLEEWLDKAAGRIMDGKVYEDEGWSRPRRG